MLLGGVVIGLGFTLGSMIVTGGADSEIAIPAAGGEAAGGVVTAGSLDASMELVGTDLADLATETLPEELPDLGDLSDLTDLDPDLEPVPDPEPDPVPVPEPDPFPWPWIDPVPPWWPPTDDPDCAKDIAEVKAAFPGVRADLIAYLVCLQPKMSPQEVIKLFNTWTSMGMTQDDINNFLTKMIHLNIRGSQLSREQIIGFIRDHTTDIPGIWSEYKQVAAVQPPIRNLDQILRDMANGAMGNYQGSKYQLDWLVAHKNQVQEVEPLAPSPPAPRPGEKGPDFILKNGTLVDVKAGYRGSSTKLGGEIAAQIVRYRNLYPNHPISYVFNSDAGNIPNSVSKLLSAQSVNDITDGIARDYVVRTTKPRISAAQVTKAQIDQAKQDILKAIQSPGQISSSTWP